MPHLALQRMLLPGVDVKTMNSGRVKSGLGKDALAQGAYDAIASYTVPSGGISSIVFAGIPQGYKHLQIVGSSQTNRSTYAVANLAITFNEDSASNYAKQGMFFFSSLGAENAVSQTYIVFPGSGAASTTTPDAFGSQIIDILDYASVTKTKTVKIFSGSNSNYTSNYYGVCGLTTGVWLNSSTAISTIKLVPTEGTLFNQNTTYDLYGVK